MVGAVGWDTGEEEQRRALTKCGLQGRNKGSFFFCFILFQRSDAGLVAGNLHPGTNNPGPDVI